MYALKEKYHKRWHMFIAVLTTLYVVIGVSICYLVVYLFADSILYSAIITAFVSAFAILPCNKQLTNSLVVAVFSATAVFAFASPLSILFCIITFIVAIIGGAFYVGFLDKHTFKIKRRENFLICLVEALLIFFCFSFLVPYSTIALIVLSSLAVWIFIGAYHGVLYMIKHPPSPEEEVVTYRTYSKALTQESFSRRLYRKLHTKFIYEKEEETPS